MLEMLLLKHEENIFESTNEMKTTVNTNHMENQTTKTYTLSLLEKDYIYSAVTLFFKFLPSVIFVYSGVNNQKQEDTIALQGTAMQCS